MAPRRRKSETKKGRTTAKTPAASPPARRRAARDAAAAGASSDPPPAAAPARHKGTDTLAASPPPQPAHESTEIPLPIVGVGASAGGLEAFSKVLHSLPDAPGLAFVLIQHQSPQHESSLAELLSSQSPLPVVTATDGTALEANHVYVNPPNAQLVLDGRMLRLRPRPSDHSQFMPIDAFLASLAETARDRAIAVILSGTGSDGTSGVREIKAAGGICIAQTPETARFDGMPRAAIASGLVDLVLEPEEIAGTLGQMGHHPYLSQAVIAEARQAEAQPPDRAQLFDRILTLLRSGTGVDFRQYKRPTIERRVHRRMVLHRLTRPDQYLGYLEENPAEVQALFQDVLILVTRFFRDPESFEALRTHALPRVLERHRDDEPIRVWVAGCSTGEEAYSVAMLLLEFLGDRASAVPVQIFATDVSEAAIEAARNGVYPAAIAADVSPGRLRRFFSKTDSGYRVSKVVRDLCVFARQDLTRDPPFSKMDIILCRNVLIYLSAAVQQKLMALFHYALKPVGYLMLGTAETIGQQSDLFRIEDKRSRLYSKKPLSGQMALPADYAVTFPQRGRPPGAPPRDDSRSVQNEANRLIQERFAPPGAIVDTEFQVVQFRGHTGKYLEPPPGDPSMSILKLAREGLLHGLRAALQAAQRAAQPVRREALRVRRNGDWFDIDLEVIPLSAGDRQHFLVLFHDVATAEPSRRTAKKEPTQRRSRARGAKPTEDEGQMARLEQELASSREYLQSIIQELEAANEELQSANEEVLSSNEELQSTNEELDTAKEELQSTNEELNTVNDELRGRNEELSRVNSDLENLLGSVQIAIVIVARDLRIRRFTPMAERVLNLIPSDVGRPIGHIKPNIDCPDLEAMTLHVIDAVTPQEQEVTDLQGNRYSLRIRPYKDLENRIDGAVLALIDLHGGDHEIDWTLRSKALAQAIAQVVAGPIVALDEGLRVVACNDAFARMLESSPPSLDGRRLWEVLGDGSLARLRAVLEREAADGEPHEVEIDEEGFPLAKRVRMVAKARRFGGAERGGALTVVAFEWMGAETGDRAGP